MRGGIWSGNNRPSFVRMGLAREEVCTAKAGHSDSEPTKVMSAWGESGHFQSKQAKTGVKTWVGVYFPSRRTS
ncbi:hypothetical protein DWU99_03585 [Dyella psychrodurans]|uniref:Uncharacterized protein n=1 Tax=Dyella psychrodurans TaxID=1927960 RepID=A0A370XDK3_9GAMM|nr:hypothetical protein DWU99_03585 [Dyella psychrodurans]